MSSIKFRFTTECQLTVEGDSYEEAYLKFKDFMHGEAPITTSDGLEVFPPEAPGVYFQIGDQADFAAIENFKGDFVADILSHSSADVQAHIDHHGVGAARRSRN